MTTGPSIGTRAAIATLGSLLVAYGVRGFLRAVGGGYYCCNHLWHGSKGALVAFVGWSILLLAFYRPTESAASD